MQVARNAEVDTETAWVIVQNEDPRLLEKSEVLLKESDHGR
jgi:hypothetical protein